MNIIDIPEPPPPTPAKTAALAIASRINSHAAQLVAAHKEIVSMLWTNPQATPDEILVELANIAPAAPARAVQVQGQSIETITGLVAIHGGEIDEILPPQYRTPPRRFQIAEDGAVTLEEVEGLDAWGRPIPEPQPEPDPPAEE